ncbi:MAG: hypothetical protein ACKOTZ_08565 [Chloroflexota bacterium]
MRQAPVTTHPPADHAGHDRLLVLRHAAGDPLDAAETRAVADLLATCGTCAALPAETAAIARSVATLPVPPRPRDFRIGGTPAAHARRGRLARLLDGLPVLRLPALQPVAGAALAIGLLVAGVGALPPGVLPGEEGVPVADAPKVGADASPLAFAMNAAEASPQAEGGAARFAASAASPDPAVAAPADATADTMMVTAAAAAAPAASATERLVIAGLLVAAAGGGTLVLVRVVRRREDPLLR